MRRGGHSALDDNERLAWGGCTRAGPECRQAQVGLLHEVQVAGPFLEPQLFERLVDDFYGRSITRQTQLHCQRVEFVLEVRHWGNLQAPAGTNARVGALKSCFIPQSCSGGVKTESSVQSQSIETEADNDSQITVREEALRRDEHA